MQKKDHLLPQLHTRFTDRGNLLPPAEVARRLRTGWRCVRFECCYSFLVVTVRHPSGPHLTPTRSSRFLYGSGYAAAALLLGPWGIPWGPIWAVRAAWTNLTGGVDVTAEVLARLEPVPPVGDR